MSSPRRSLDRALIAASLVGAAMNSSLPAPAMAQAGAAAGDMTAFVDSIQTVADTLSLLRLANDESGGIASRLAGGFAGMQLFRLTGRDEHAVHARDLFEEATDLAPDNAWAWFGLGTTWADGPEQHGGPPRIVTARAVAEALGRDAGSRAVRALRRALDNDPDLVPAAVALVPVAIAKRNRDALEVARLALARAEAAGRFSIDGLRALAEAERVLGNAGRAADVARRAATMSGDDPEVTYDLALALFSVGRDQDGARAWFDAVEGLTPSLADRLHDDLAPLASEWEADRWERADRTARVDWLRDFWPTRAALGGVSLHERIGDHYRRLEVARDLYFRRRKWGAPPGNALLLERPDLPFDDRGIIFVRHGQPLDIIRGRDNESWVYRPVQGDFRMVHFFRYGSASRPLGAVGNPGASAADGALGDGYNEYVLVHVLPCGDWIDGRHTLYDRRLALLRCNDDRLALSAEIRRDAWEALRTDSDRPHFDTDLSFATELYTFRGDDGLTDVTAAILIPAGELSPVPAFGGVAYEIDVSFIVADTLFDRVARTDTMLRIVRPAPVEDGRGLRISINRPVTPGSAQAQRMVIRETADPGHGQLYGGPIDVPDYHRRDLLISDIVLAEPDSGGAFSRGDVSLSLVPTGEFPAGEFQVFYEVYNLTPDSEFGTEIVVEKAGGGIGGVIRGLFGRGPEVRLRFDGVAAPVNALSRELRRVDTSLGAGDYRIRVRVTDRSTGRTAERERTFTVARSRN